MLFEVGYSTFNLFLSSITPGVNPSSCASFFICSSTNLCMVLECLDIIVTVMFHDVVVPETDPYFTEPALDLFMCLDFHTNNEKVE